MLATRPLYLCGRVQNKAWEIPKKCLHVNSITQDLVNSCCLYKIDTHPFERHYQCSVWILAPTILNRHIEIGGHRLHRVYWFGWSLWDFSIQNLNWVELFPKIFLDCLGKRSLSILDVAHPILSYPILESVCCF